MLRKKIARKALPKKTEDDLTNIINFHSTMKNFCEFSNFHHSPFSLDGVDWKTVEHYFQAQKTLKESDKEMIRGLSSPKEAKKIGKKVTLRSDWDQIKIGVMTKAIRAKFSQSEALKGLLLSTGSKELREHTGRDKFWGDGGGNGRGRNELGKILMKVRVELREEKK